MSSDAAALVDYPRIPHIIHQSWRDAALVPRGLQSAILSWRRIMPKWHYEFHSDADNLRLVQARYPWLVPFFMRSSAIQRADISRYMYMHAVGGVYADLDVELLQPLTPLLRQLRRERGLNASVILGQEPLAHAVLLEYKPRQVCNAVLASVKGHPFWLEVLHRIASARGGGTDPVGSTGPRLLERVVREWHVRHGGGGGIGGGGVVVVAPDIFYPTWDPMQRKTFRERCVRAGGGMRVLRTPRAVALDEMRERTCARLRREGFRPTVVPEAFTNHLWTHTWINGASKVSLGDVFRLERGRR